MTNKKPLVGLCLLNFLFSEAVNGDDDDLYFGQARCLLQGFELVEGDLRQSVILLLGVCHQGYSLPAGKYTIAVLPNCLTSTVLSSWLLATTSNKRGNVTLLFRLMDTSLYPRMVVITLLLIWLLVMVSTIACAFILCLLFVYLTMNTLYSNKLYVYTPQILGGEGHKVTLLRLSPLPRYILATIKGGVYVTINEKATSRVAHSKIINASRRPTAGNLIKPHFACGLFNFAMCQILARFWHESKFKFCHYPLIASVSYRVVRTYVL